MADHWLSPDYYLGKVVAFTPDPVHYAGGLVENDKRYFGEVIRAQRAEDYGAGKIPDMALRIRGRSGKTINVTVIGNFVSVYSSYADATVRDHPVQPSRRGEQAQPAQVSSLDASRSD